MSLGMLKLFGGGLRGQKLVPRTMTEKVISISCCDCCIFSLNWSVRSLLNDISARLSDLIVYVKASADL